MARIKTREQAILVDNIVRNKDRLSRFQSTLSDIETKIKERQEALNTTKDLSKRGVSFDLIKRFGKLEFKSGEELTSRINTVQAYELETRKHVQVVQKMRNLEQEITRLNKKKLQSSDFLIKLEKGTRLQNNELELTKKKTRTYRKAVELAEGLLQEGYSFEDLTSLRHGLHLVALKGRPTLSLTHYLEGLQNVKILNALLTEIEEKKKTLNILNLKIAIANG